MSTLTEQAHALSRALTTTDTARRAAEVAGDLEMRNMYALSSAEQVRDATREVRGALLLSWMLERTRTVELLGDAAAALQVALAYAVGDLDRTAEGRADELAGCAEVLCRLTEATS